MARRPHSSPRSRVPRRAADKPPFPTTHGLFQEPTAINNPETLLNVLDIVQIGADGYRSRGTDSRPNQLLCLSGRVAKPGVYEVEFGTTLGEVLELRDSPVPANSTPS